MQSAVWLSAKKTEDMYRIIDVVTPHMPTDRPRYLMGVGTPGNIIEAVARGVDPV